MARDMNNAFFMKLAWKLACDSSALWLSVLKNKYNMDQNLVPLDSGSKVSNMWKGIGKVWDVTCMGTTWAIGNGNTARFWVDNWTGLHCRLVQLANTSVPINERTRVMSCYVLNGNWNRSAFAHLIPNSVMLAIAAIKPPQREDGDDLMF